ncbi:MAG: lipid A deacylase LpxR family protein [Rhodothalassiaceae bacterium]
MQPSFRFALLALALGCLPAAVLAQTDQQFLTFSADNDLYARAGDRHYTNGLRIAYGFKPGVRSPLLNWLGALTVLDADPARREYEIAVGQNLYTPEDLSIAEPQPLDRPYAAWLYAELGVRVHRPGVEEGLSISLGVVGPAALGEETQRFIHDITNSINPLGWDNQLRNEPALLIRYRRSWFVPLNNASAAGPAIDLVPRLGLDLGNVFTDAGAGVNLRIGSTLPERDMPQRIPLGLSGIASRFEPPAGGIEWLIFAGAQVRGVAHNIFLDGNSFRDGPAVERRPFQWDATIGAQIVFDLFSIPTQIAVTHVWRSREFEQQIGRNRFGSLTVGFAF